MKDLPIKQVFALHEFAHRNGRYWKAALREKWMNGLYDSDDDSQSLQSLRNSTDFGPAGLVGYRLRKAEKNVYWSEVPKEAFVAERGNSYVALLPSGDRKLVFWSGSEAMRAINYLSSLVNKSAKRATEPARS